MVTLTIQDEHSEVSITRDVPNLEQMLELMEDALRAHGFCFKGQLIIEEND